MTQGNVAESDAGRDPYMDLICVARRAARALRAADPLTDLPAAVWDAANKLSAHLRANVRNRGEPLELHDFPTRLSNPADVAVAATARDMYVDDELQIDDPPVLSKANDGAWVMAWVWVPADDDADDDEIVLDTAAETAE